MGCEGDFKCESRPTTQSQDRQMDRTKKGEVTRMGRKGTYEATLINSVKPPSHMTSG